MAVLKPFKAFRPSKENQNKIPDLPYDVMRSEEARKMVKNRPKSFLHIDRAEVDLPEGTDMYSATVYAKARDNLENLEKNGDLIQDEKPCFYIYRQIMDGREQTGIVGCASIDDYKNDIIKKHENTLFKKEKDRINHVYFCNANTGPIFLTYKKTDAIKNITENWTEQHKADYDFFFDGVRQTVWVVDDEKVNEKISSCFARVPYFYIADGHHRSASAVFVGDQKRKEKPDYTGEEEFNYFLAVLFPDDDLEIMDYNRVVRDLNGNSQEEFLSKVKEKFEIESIENAEKPAKRHEFSMYLSGQWYRLKAKDGTFDEEDVIGSLDVSILQNNLLDPILGIKDPKNDDRIDFIGGIRGLGELKRRADSDMKVAFAMHPVSVNELMQIADAGKIMPPKSTWFEPKLLSGLFIHHLD